VDLFGRGGLAILDRIEAQGFDVLSRRPTLSKAAKVGLLFRAWLRHTIPGIGRTPAPVATTTARAEGAS
jgi:hypothetical protein